MVIVVIKQTLINSMFFLSFQSCQESYPTQSYRPLSLPCCPVNAQWVNITEATHKQTNKHIIILYIIWIPF